jgi:hypothetical protein
VLSILLLLVAVVAVVE